MPTHSRFKATKPKSPPELVAKVKESLEMVREALQDRARERAMEDVARHVEQMKGLVEELVCHLKCLDFETRKDVGLVVGALLRVKLGDWSPMAEHVAKHEDILRALVECYEDRTDPHLGLVAGSILRDVIRHEQLARILAESDMLVMMFSEIEEVKFEIAADVFATFREVVVRHKKMIGEVLDERYAEIFPKLNALTQSENFFIKRQSLKLLSEILMEPENRNAAKKYVQDVQNLIMLMQLLRNRYDSIQFEAFHSFKVFLIGEEKAPEVLDILRKNKAKLLRFLEAFQREKADADEDFAEEKKDVCSLIQQIPD